MRCVRSALTCASLCVERVPSLREGETGVGLILRCELRRLYATGADRCGANPQVAVKDAVDKGEIV